MRTLKITVEELNENSQKISKVERYLDWDTVVRFDYTTMGRILGDITKELGEMLDALKLEENKINPGE